MFGEIISRGRAVNVVMDLDSDIIDDYVKRNMLL